MKKFALLLLLVIFSYPLFASPFYVAFGVNNIIPTGDFDNTNKPSLAFNFQIQNRSLCNLWYGFRLDYSKLDPVESAPAGTNFFDSYFLFSPELRYVFLLSGKPNYDDTFYIFLQTLLNFSSITRKQKTDESNFGIGGSFGAGIGFCFIFADMCWTIELGSIYSAPNFILKSNLRPTLTNFNLGLNLGVGL
ncbi:MAG: hypothetical protein N2517_05580 [Ignavibacteria bacterium]|nr:hypothetical protein [Ignavibacteria bacterium]